MRLMAEDEACLDCEEYLAALDADPEYEGRGGSPREPYSEGYHLCSASNPRIVKGRAENIVCADYQNWGMLQLCGPQDFQTKWRARQLFLYIRWLMTAPRPCQSCWTYHDDPYCPDIGGGG